MRHKRDEETETTMAAEEAAGNVRPTARSGVSPSAVEEDLTDKAVIENAESDVDRSRILLVTDSTGKLIRAQGTNV